MSQQEIDKLTAEIQAKPDADSAVAHLVRGIAAQIDATKTDPVALTALSDALKNSAVAHGKVVSGKSYGASGPGTPGGGPGTSGGIGAPGAPGSTGMPALTTPGPGTEDSHGTDVGGAGSGSGSRSAQAARAPGDRR